MSEVEKLIIDESNKFRGRMLGLVESFGLKESQEAGMKQMIKSLSYDSQAKIIDAVKNNPE